jgi:hypothetical protein
MRSIHDARGRELRVGRDGHAHTLIVQPTASSTRILDRTGVRELLDVIASTPPFRRDMRDALAVYEIGARR